MHRRRRLAVLAVGALAFVVFLPSLSGGFVYDDAALITDNEYVHAFRWLPRAFTTHLWDVSPLASASAVFETTRRYYRPIVTVSLLVTWALAGGKAWLFHLTNVTLHAATSALATRAAIRWSRSLSLGAVAGVFFAIHPSRSENVTWICGRMDVLMLLFVLLSLEAFARFERTCRWPWFGAGVLALAAGLLSKEPAVMMPFVLLARPGKRDLRVLGTVGALCVAYAGGREVLWRPEGSAVVHDFTPLHFLFTVGSYAHRIFAPWPLAMFVDAVPYVNGAPVYGTATVFLGVLGVAAAIAGLVVAWRRSSTAFWLFVAAGAFIGPLLNLFYNGMKDGASDRFLYAPLLFGLAAAARLAGPRVKRLARTRSFVLAASGLALVAIGFIELRTLDFRSDETFWRAEMANEPRDPQGPRMLARLAASRGELDVALALYRQGRRPETAPFQREKPSVIAHFEEAAIVAALLPDGRFAEVRALSDELWRVVEPATTPSPASVFGLAIGHPLDKSSLAELSAHGRFRWEAALLATRTGDFVRAERASSTASAGGAAVQPQNAILVLARLGHDERASELGERVGGLAELSPRLTRARSLAEQRYAAAPDRRASLEALRLAELGAYWAAFRIVVEAHLLDEPAVVPFATQLLVACRLDAAAQTYATKQLGARGELVVGEQALPPSLAALPRVSTPLEEVVAAAQ